MKSILKRNLNEYEEIEVSHHEWKLLSRYFGEVPSFIKPVKKERILKRFESYIFESDNGRE
jgi:hypothetical protein